jgi:5'-phosphate synthase pdxT subunit
LKIGILALQGDFFKHGLVVKQLGHDVLYIKDAETLNQCDKLILPGGESTTFLKLIDKLEMREALVQFAKEKKIMGTCAGLITLAAKVVDFELSSLNLIDIVVKRNAYGRQIDSFIDDVRLEISEKSETVEGVFIRAPKINELGKSVKALAYHKEDVVMAANKNILVITFHPELSDDTTIHKYFIDNFN